MKIFTRFLKNARGATAIEYGLIAALVSTAAILGMGQLGTKLNSQMANLGTKMNG